MDWKEIIIRMFYILNLNLPPIFSTILYFVTISVQKEISFLLMLSWLIYILTLLILPRLKKRRKLTQIIDSIFIYFFMNSFHLRGLYHSIRNIFTREKLFVKTPKNILNSALNDSSGNQIGYFEIFEIVILFCYYAYFIFSNSIVIDILYYIFPVSYITIIAGAVIRFIGFENFIESLFNRLIKAPLLFIAGIFKR